MMEIKPIYDNAGLLFIALLSLVLLAGPSLIAMLIAREKGYRFMPLGYFMYSFIGTPVVYLSIYYASSGVVRYFLAGLILPLYILAPIWHARRLAMTKKLQSASEAQGVRLRSCYYCNESFDAESTICPTCRHKTPLSLIANRYILLFGLSVLTFVFAFFMAVDEYFYNSNTYNMLSAFFNVVDMLPYVAVSKSTELTGLFFVQLFAVMGCAFYTVVLILQTVHCLTKGKSVANPTFLFFVAIYITVGHPLLFWSFTIKSGDDRGLAVSLAWGFWVISYLLLWVSLYSLHTEKKHQDEPTITPWNQS